MKEEFLEIYEFTQKELELNSIVNDLQITNPLVFERFKKRKGYNSL